MDALLGAALLSPVLDLYVHGKTKDALEVCEAIAGENPECADAHAMLSELYQREGDAPAWLDSAKRANELDPIRFRAALVHAQITCALLHAEADDAYALLEDLAQLLVLDLADEAAAVFHFLRERHRSNLDVANAVQSILGRCRQDALLREWGEVAPQILLVLPRRVLEAATINRLIKSVEQNLGHHPVVLASRGGQRGSVEAGQTDAFLPWESVNQDCYSHFVVVEDSDDRDWTEELARKCQRVYRFDQSTHGYEARLLPVGRDVGPEDYPFVASHIFNRVTTNLHGHYYYFPYGYLFRYLGYGPINAFGHRLDQDPAPLRDRPSHHKLVVCFGGSSCYSMYCLHDEMFSSRLEVKLNERSRREGAEFQFTVLNFGQHGNVALNEMMTYLLFAQTLRPDVVISHSGFNDLMYGQMSDPALVAGHQIAYQDNLETWAAMLNGSVQDLPDDRYIEGVRQVRNQPAAVIDAYLTRLRQFGEVVVAGGARFLWGLQPWLQSKRARSMDEKGYLHESMETFSPFRDGYRNLHFLYDELEARHREMRDVQFLNLHRAFAALPAEVTHFYDIVHLSPEGDERIADLYAAALHGEFKGVTA